MLHTADIMSSPSIAESWEFPKIRGLAWRLLCSSFLVMTYDLFAYLELSYTTQTGTTLESPGNIYIYMEAPNSWALIMRTPTRRTSQLTAQPSPFRFRTLAWRSCKSQSLFGKARLLGTFPVPCRELFWACSVQPLFAVGAFGFLFGDFSGNLADSVFSGRSVLWW